MSLQTLLGFYRAHWLSLTLGLVITALYLTSALINEDYDYALAGVVLVVFGVGWLWRRHESA
ncbi:hypothetical protein [Halalkalicoccus subterraneus]|uniref:hypothetical protein n=1 Tax=Halalkalicoccus subterraneus TaxID=2675002 RepID=UPI000EFA8995|nr:hypothetical protein [Halalkalicoccus subterraneus]